MKTLIDNTGEDRLRAFLKAAIDERRPGLSARELARRCERYGYKVNESYISQFLSGARRSLSFRALRPISRVLGVSYLQLLLLAGYITAEDLEAVDGSQDGVIRETRSSDALSLAELSLAGKQLVKEYYEFIHMKDISLSGRQLVKEFYEFTHGFPHLEVHLAS